MTTKKGRNCSGRSIHSVVGMWRKEKIPLSGRFGFGQEMEPGKVPAADESQLRDSPKLLFITLTFVLKQRRPEYLYLANPNI